MLIDNSQFLWLGHYIPPQKKISGDFVHVPRSVCPNPSPPSFFSFFFTAIKEGNWGRKKMGGGIKGRRIFLGGAKLKIRNLGDVLRVASLIWHILRQKRVCSKFFRVFSAKNAAIYLSKKNSKNAIIYAQRQFLFSSLRVREGRKEGERRMFHYKIYAKEKEKGKKDPPLKKWKGRERKNAWNWSPPCFIFRKIKKRRAPMPPPKPLANKKKFPFSRKLLLCGIFGGTY